MTTKTPRLTVTVTEVSIRDARQGRTDFIAGEEEFDGTIHPSSGRVIAQAVKAAHPGARRVTVDLQSIRFSDPERGLRFTYLTPRVVQEALLHMDQGAPVDPFAFDLDEPFRTSRVVKRED